MFRSHSIALLTNHNLNVNDVPKIINELRPEEMYEPEKNAFRTKTNATIKPKSNSESTSEEFLSLQTI